MTIMGAVRCFMGKNQKTWDVFLPQLAGALRSSVNRSTGFIPNRLMLHREVNQPAELMFHTPGLGESEPQPPEQYVMDLAKALLESHEAARANLKTAQLRAKLDYDLKMNSREFKVGELVYQLDTATVKGKWGSSSKN